MRSEIIADLAAALSKAQGAFPDVPKDRTAKIASAKGNYEYQYADLATMIKATRPALAANGLTLAQPVGQDDHGMFVETLLAHASGQWLSERLYFTQGQRMQETGSSITYLRRYALGGMLGIASDDDTDGQESPPQSTPAKPARAPAPSPSPAPQKSIVGDPGASTPVPKPVTSVAKASAPDVNRSKVMAAAQAGGWPPESVTRYIDAAYGVKLVRDLTSDQVEYLIKVIKAKSTVEAMASLGEKPADTSFDFGDNAPTRIGS